MSKESVPARYHPALVALHWIVALLIFFMLAAGKLVLLMMPNTAEKIIPLTGHVSIGIAILVLLVVRFIVRTVTPKPAPADAGHPLLNRIGVATHYLLYLAAFGMVLSGLGMAQMSNLFQILFGNTGLPLPESFWVYPPRIGHGITATVLMLLILLHVGAAFYHQFIRRDNLLARMWFGKR
jgi:cytochrome b561